MTTTSLAPSSQGASRAAGGSSSSSRLRIASLLGVWAHPDDEAYLSAGLMARVRREGGRVVVATATLGERGTDDPQGWPPERLAPVREAELAESLAAVGVREHYWLGHRDGELPQVPRRTAVRQVVRLLEAVRPEVVVTFGPDGMTGHDDHRLVSSWVTEAWARAGADARLWYATMTPEWHATWGALNDRVGLWFEGATPPSTPRSELVAEVRCAGAELDAKHRALRAHASQTRGLEELVGSDTYRRWFAEEAFVEKA